MVPEHQTQQNDLFFHLLGVTNFQGDKMHDGIYESIIKYKIINKHINIYTSINTILVKLIKNNI